MNVGGITTALNRKVWLRRNADISPSSKLPQFPHNNQKRYVQYVTDQSRQKFTESSHLLFQDSSSVLASWSSGLPLGDDGTPILTSLHVTGTSIDQIPLSYLDVIFLTLQCQVFLLLTLLGVPVIDARHVNKTRKWQQSPGSQSLGEITETDTINQSSLWARSTHEYLIKY